MIRRCFLSTTTSRTRSASASLSLSLFPFLRSISCVRSISITYMADNHHHHYLNIPNTDARDFLTRNPITAVMSPENRPCSTVLLPSAATFHLPHPGFLPRGLSSNLSLPFDHQHNPFYILNNYDGVVGRRHHDAPGGNNGPGGGVDELGGHDYAIAALSMDNAAEMAEQSGAGYVNFGGFDYCDAGGNGGGPGSLEYYSSCGNIESSRWPRQEALCLIDIRTKLDPKFREATHKGPLWNEVSRLMEVEYGYKRCPNKCREKLDNLYKYYKKTKEGKAGRHDGKHYRFFRQLDALFGAAAAAASINTTADPSSSWINSLIPAAAANNSNNTNIYATTCNVNLHGFHHHNTNATSGNLFQQLLIGLSGDSLSSLSNSSVFATTPTHDDLGQAAEGSGVSTEDHGPRKKKKKTTREERISDWKSRITEFIDTRMKGLIDEQEERLGKMMRMLESREQERMQREEEWRKQEAERAEHLHQFWAREHATIKARDVDLIEALEKLVGSRVVMKERDTSPS